MKLDDPKNLKLYPHFKITNEKFPRLLITRKIENDKAEYFGAFLPKAGTRILLDFLNKTFQLRSCEIDIDGEFPFPCPMFYRKRCLAPCVEDICGEKEYLEMVELLRLFLRNESEILKAEITIKIEKLSENFDFEKAAKWRDFLFEIEKVWKNKRWQFWLEDAIDTWEIKTSDNKQTYIYLVTQRGRKILGKRVFYVDRQESYSETLKNLMLGFYRIYAPKEIRVYTDFESRTQISDILSNQFGRKISVNIFKQVTPTTRKGFSRTDFEHNLSKISYQDDIKTVRKNLKKIFCLKKIPKRIEAYDAAHISGTNVVTAKIVWENNEFLYKQNEVWFFEECGEPAALKKAVKDRFTNVDNLPDLVLIDGGKAQMKAVLEGVSDLEKRDFKIISAVKPAGKHNEISHFLNENFEKIRIPVTNSALNFLTRIRDAAHNLANQTHKIKRDTSHFYELAQTLPTFSEDERRFILQKIGSIKKLKNADFINLKKVFENELAERIFKEIQREYKSEIRNPVKLVPIRFDAPNGEAEDLQPIDRYALR